MVPIIFYKGDHHEICRLWVFSTISLRSRNILDIKYRSIVNLIYLCSNQWFQEHSSLFSNASLYLICLLSSSTRLPRICRTRSTSGPRVFRACVLSHTAGEIKTVHILTPCFQYLACARFLKMISFISLLLTFHDQKRRVGLMLARLTAMQQSGFESRTYQAKADL